MFKCCSIVALSAFALYVYVCAVAPRIQVNDWNLHLAVDFEYLVQYMMFVNLLNDFVSNALYNL